MFWRRSRPKEAAAEETDDLAKLQKQFGITPVRDVDVQAEFQALFGATGGGGSSVGGEDDEEEARILRELQLDGVTLDEDESDSHHKAKDELRGVLQMAYETARESHRQEAADMTSTPLAQQPGKGAAVELSQEVATQIHALKVEAVTLKREGKVKEALAKFREAKQLQEQISTQESGGQGGGSLSGLSIAVGEMKAEETARVPMKTLLGDGDVEVTDEDMQDPEFLAQLATMGLTEKDEASCDTEANRYHDVVQLVSALETQIHEYKLQALQLKRQNRITEALACMRKVKELEAKRDGLRSFPVMSTQGPAVQKLSVPQVTESVSRVTAVNTSTVVRSNSGAGENQPDSDNDSISDVEVTAEDMNDPAFAQELLKLNGADTLPIEASLTEVSSTLRTTPGHSADLTKVVLPTSRSLRNAPSIDEDYLIDAFDDRPDSDEETGHLSSVMSSGSLRSALSTADTESTTMPTEEVVTEGDAENYHITDLTAQLQKARHTALSLKRKGDIQGALESMRRAKQIENLIGFNHQASGIPAIAFNSDKVSFNSAKFQEIEQLLVDFGNRAMTVAKENLSVNRAKASEWLTKRKRYGADLEKLRQMRQNPLQLAPHYEIVKASHQVNFELPFVADDQIKVSVKSVNGLSQVAGKSVFVKLCLNFPSATPHECQTDEFQININAPFSTEVSQNKTTFVFKLARSRGTMRLFEIKKAVFEVWKPGTLFRNPEIVARAYQELTPLLTCCEIITHIPFLGPNRKPCGGDVEIALQMRRPLKEKETRLELVEDLVIGDYPEPMSTFPKHAPMPSVVLEPDTYSSSDEEKAPATNRSSAVVQDEKPAPATALLDDPHHVDLIISYDVINEELEKMGVKLSSLTGPTALEWSDRYDSLALKKQLLEIEMQTGRLTLDMYVERLHNRISGDRVLISQLLAANRRLDAARVLHRIRIMEKELQGAGGDTEES